MAGNLLGIGMRVVRDRLGVQDDADDVSGHANHFGHALQEEAYVLA